MPPRGQSFPVSEALLVHRLRASEPVLTRPARGGQMGPGGTLCCVYFNRQPLSLWLGAVPCSRSRPTVAISLVPPLRHPPTHPIFYSD